jgi:hypothetical protein
LRPAFDKTGQVTAGNASGLNDGAAAVLVMSAQRALALGLQPLAVIRGYASAGLDPTIMGMGPVPASRLCLEKAGWKAQDLDLMEINEAFAAQACAVNQEMGWDTSKINVNGGAIAIGHPIGASGCRILVTLLHEMRPPRRQQGPGLAVHRRRHGRRPAVRTGLNESITQGERDDESNTRGSGHRRHGRPGRKRFPPRWSMPAYKVAVTYSPGNAKHAEWVAQMKAKGYDILAVPCDVADIDSCHAAVAQVQEKLGAVDVLVNNAGITRDMTFKKMDKVNWDGAAHQPRQPVQHDQAGGRQHGRARLGPRHQRLVGQRLQGRFRPDQLLGRQGRRARLHQGAGARGGEEGRHGQHHLARLHRHQDGHGDSEGSAGQQDPAAHPGGPPGQARKKWPA